MSLAKDFEISEYLGKDIIIPPTDLWSNEPPLESDLQFSGERAITVSNFKRSLTDNLYI